MLTPRQLADWRRYYQVSPFGDGRADARMARIAWSILQPHKFRDITEQSLMLNYEPPREPITGAEYQRLANARYAARAAKTT